MFRFLVLFLVCNVSVILWQFIGNYFICWVACLLLYLFTGIYLCNPVVVLIICIASTVIRQDKKRRTR